MSFHCWNPSASKIIIDCASKIDCCLQQAGGVEQRAERICLLGCCYGGQRRSGIEPANLRLRLQLGPCFLHRLDQHLRVWSRCRHLQHRFRIRRPQHLHATATQFYLIDQRIAVEARPLGFRAGQFLHVGDDVGVGYRNHVQVAVVIVRAGDLLGLVAVVEQEILLLVEIIPVQGKQHPEFLSERPVDALENAGHDLVALLDQGKSGRSRLVGLSFTGQHVLNRGNLLRRLDQHAQQIEQHRRWAGVVKPEDIVPHGSVAVVFDALPLTDPERHGPAANVDPVADEAATAVLDRRRVQHLIDRRIDRLGNVLQQPAKPNVVERPVRSRDESVFGEILPPVDAHDPVDLSLLLDRVLGLYRLAAGHDRYIVSAEARNQPRDRSILGRGDDVGLWIAVIVEVDVAMLLVELDGGGFVVRHRPVIRHVGLNRNFAP